MVSCCSLKSLAIWVVAIAVFVKVGNPLLDALIVPDDEKSERQPFANEKTDVLNYTEMGFLATEEMELDIGLSLIMTQSFPKWLTTLLGKGDTIDFSQFVNHGVDILDARKQPDLSFEETGFTLVQLNAPTETTNWRSQDNVKLFQDELKPHLMKLYPDATRIVYTHSVVRGGTQLGDQPAAVNAPHLDYTQNDSARTVFHEEYPPMAIEQNLLLGYNNTGDEEMAVLLGIWKPILMSTPVCDFPLAVMDASTFSSAQERLNKVHINLGFFQLHNLNGAVKYASDQSWFYYPFQTESEALIFTQYTKDRHFANPHGSFENSNCPEGYDTRVSIEMRAAVFRPKQKDSKREAGASPISEEEVVDATP